MKQNSIFSYVKRNNNNSEGVDGKMSSVVQMQKSHQIRSAPNVIQLPKLENRTTHICDMSSFCQTLNVADTFQKCKNNRVIKFLAF